MKTEELQAQKAAKRDKQRYMRVSHCGSSCVMEMHEAAALLTDAPGVYDSAEVWMTRTEFEALPDFGGW
jgi:hypothetical protein